MGFALCGIEILPTLDIYGVWFFSVRHEERDWKRPMFGIHYDMDTWIIHLLFFQIEI